MSTGSVFYLYPSHIEPEVGHAFGGCVEDGGSYKRRT
jgi:hypothetical protein